MNFGLGTDIIEVGRIKKICERWKDRFFYKIFSKEELTELDPDSFFYYQSVAGRFAAKEAVLKSLGLYGLRIALKDIVIKKSGIGVPGCRISGAEDFDISLSISHEREYAVATAISQKREK